MPRSLKNWWVFVGILVVISAVEFGLTWPIGVGFGVYLLLALTLIGFSFVFYRNVEGQLGRGVSLISSLAGCSILIVYLYMGLFSSAINANSSVCTTDPLGSERCYDTTEVCWVPDLRNANAVPPIGQQPCPEIRRN
jgi:hypothetical protein